MAIQLGGPEITGGDKIGTPAWAALATTSPLPSVKGLTTVDDWVRGFLQDFSSIPRKALQLSTEVQANW